MNTLNPLNGVNALNSLNQTSFQSIQTAGKDTAPVKSSFDGFFDAAVKLLEETNLYQIQDEQLQLDYATGKTDDMLAVVMAQQKAYSALNFTVQVTNKVIEAYREIMRISL